MNSERLLKLADHLEHGKLGHKVFVYRSWNTNKAGIGNPYPEWPSGDRCGYAGCAASECRVLWPDEWKFAPQLTSKTTGKIEYEALADWFDISEHDAKVLFDSETNGPGPLATKEEVTEHIRAFVAKHS